MHRLARLRVADVDEARLLLALGDEHRAVRAPVDRTADTWHALEHPVGGDRLVQRLDRLGSHRFAVRPRRVDGLERQQDAQLGVIGEVRHRRRRQLPSGGDPPLLLGLAALVQRDEPADQGDHQRHRDRHELAAEAPVDPHLPRRGGATRRAPRRREPHGWRRGTPARARPASRRVTPWRRGRPAGAPRGTARRGHGPGRPSPAAASRSWPRAMRTSRSSSIHPRSRGHSRRSASWATSTVGSRVCRCRSRLRSRASAHRSITSPTDGGVQISDQLRPRRGSPGGLTVGVDHHQLLEHAAHGVPVVVVERSVELLGPGRDGAGHTAELPVRRQRERPSARPRPARTA